MARQAFLLHALTPLHAGTGHAAGVIDLPIARMKATGIPFVPPVSTSAKNGAIIGVFVASNGNGVNVPSGPLNTAYATVYPLAVILKIILAQLLLAVR